MKPNEKPRDEDPDVRQAMAAMERAAKLLLQDGDSNRHGHHRREGRQTQVRVTAAELREQQV